MRISVICLAACLCFFSAEAQPSKFFTSEKRALNVQIDDLQKQAGQLIAKKFKLLKQKNAKRDKNQPALQEEESIRLIDVQLAALNRQLSNLKRDKIKQEAEHPRSPN